MPTWQLIGTTAQLEAEQLRARVELQQPQLGIHELAWRTGSGLDLTQAHLLQLKLPAHQECESVFECWTRTNDLVAVYASSATRPSQPEIYWRALQDSTAEGWELIVSVHTEILDDDPRIEITSELQAREVLWMPVAGSVGSARCISKSASPHLLQEADGNGVSLMRLQGSLTYLEMVYPSDFCSVEIAFQDGHVRLQSTLFPERLEKGVIRRGRIQGWLVPTANDLELAGRLYERFRDSDPPLTT